MFWKNYYFKTGSFLHFCIRTSDWLWVCWCVTPGLVVAGSLPLVTSFLTTSRPAAHCQLCRQRERDSEFWSHKRSQDKYLFHILQHTLALFLNITKYKDYPWDWPLAEITHIMTERSRQQKTFSRLEVYNSDWRWRLARQVRLRDSSQHWEWWRNRIEYSLLLVDNKHLEIFWYLYLVNIFLWSKQKWK